MNGEDMTFLAARAEAVEGRADQRLAEVKARIRRTRQRRAVAAVAATSGAVLALVIGLTVLTGPAGRQGDSGPPAPATSSDPPRPSAVRKIVYNDDLAFGPASEVLIHIPTVHVGDRLVAIDQTLHSVRSWSMFVTDAGAVYAQDDQSVWFTDGGRPRQLTPRACVYPAADYERLGLATGNAGPLVAWFDCAPASRGDLVVYDTTLAREVARHPIRSCRTAYECTPHAIVGQHVYFGHFGTSGRAIDDQFRLDLTSDRVQPAGREAYADDLRANRRALVIGDTWRTGIPTESRGGADSVDFHVIGSRLVPARYVAATDRLVPTRAFDTATGRPVRFRLPRGYDGADHAPGFDVPEDPDALEGNDTFATFEWLDDDTVALMGNYLDDIITCHLSDGRCTVAVGRPRNSESRLMPGGYLPG